MHFHHGSENTLQSFSVFFTKIVPFEDQLILGVFISKVFEQQHNVMQTDFAQ